MVRTLTLNPAVDKSVSIDRFTVGEVNRIGTVRLDAGGKGLNVARVLHQLGTSALAVAPVGGGAGAFLEQRVAEEGIPHHFVPIRGETRTNLKVYDPVLGSHTDLNEPGPALESAEVEALEGALLHGIGKGDWVVASGSIPRGLPRDLYGRWLSLARERGAQTVLDAEGEAFALALAARPNLIKPNLAELEGWLGRSITSDDDLFQAVDELRRAGAQTVAISLGARGAWLFHGEGAWFAPGLVVKALSTVGAGDALLAGLIAGFAADLTPADVLAEGVAAATAAVVHSGTGGGDAETRAAFRARVAVLYQPMSRRTL